MKKFVLLTLAGIALFAFIFAASILWYRFFYAGEGVKEYSSVEVKLDSDSNTIDEDGLIPLDDETAKLLTPYEFSVKNNGSSDALYNVLLEDSIISDDETYSSKELLSRTQLKYQLSLDGQVIKQGNLKDIKNNILDTRTISSGKTNNYQLRIYVSQDAVNTNWQNKYYHFNVNVKMEEEL